MRKHRAGGKVVEFRSKSDQPTSSSGLLAEAVRAALDEVGTADTWEGRAALRVAERIDATGQESGAGFAALNRDLREAMELALKPRPGQSWADELRRKRLDRAGA